MLSFNRTVNQDRTNNVSGYAVDPTSTYIQLRKEMRDIVKDNIGLLYSLVRSNNDVNHKITANLFHYNGDFNYKISITFYLTYADVRVVHWSKNGKEADFARSYSKLFSRQSSTVKHVIKMLKINI